jgi:signal transduction histidine kinase
MTILERKPRWLVVGATIASIVLIGLLDYAAGPEFSFSVFYLAPLAMAAWLVGLRFAYMVAVACATVSVLGDLANGLRYANSLAPFWNGAILLAFYAIVVSLLTRLRSATVQLEQRVKERTAELRNQIESRKEVEAKLRQAQKMEAVGQLTGGIAHDFNNLLTVIIGNLAAARGDLAEGRTPAADRMDHALAAAERAATLTKRLLAFARRQPLRPSRVEVASMLDNVAGILRPTVGPNIEVALEVAPGAWRLRADENQLENAILNLAVNARDALKSGGRIDISARNVAGGVTTQDGQIRDGDFVAIEVKDNGVGMSPAVMERAFDPFFTTKPMGEGTGLGLSQVYGFVRQSDGEIAIESEEGRGTRVTIFLRRDLGKGASDAVAVEPSKSPDLGAGQTVLLVEDEDLLRLFAVRSLETAGYTVIATASAEKALTIIASTPRLALLVTDVGLPGINGRQLAEMARASRPDLAVLFMTGYTPSFEERSGMARSAVLLKPFMPEDLHREVANLMTS